MNISILESYEKISQLANSMIMSQLERNKKLLICAATGGSPTGTYRLMIEEYNKQPGLFSEISIIKLDEWGGIPMDDPGTCESYLRHNLIKPLNVPDSRYISFNSLAVDPNLECKRIQKAYDLYGSIDVCILGLGINGHIALNEPSDLLEPRAHVANLSDITLQHSMVHEMSRKPLFGLTLGMADILQSKMIILLISGASKKKITRKFLLGKLTTSLPASFLWLHSNVECLLDNEAADADIE
jgi:galactosamine-6-phosphate isomerase